LAHNTDVRHREKQADKRAIDNDEAMDDGSDCYHFLGYDPAVLAQLSPDVLDTLGCVLTKRRGISVSLVEQIIESVSKKMSFMSKQKDLLSLQKRLFCQCKGVFVVHAKTVRTEGQQQIITVDADEYESAEVMLLDDTLPYPFRSRQYVQELLFLVFLICCLCMKRV
jgi:hypothetical protein